MWYSLVTMLLTIRFLPCTYGEQSLKWHSFGNFYFRLSSRRMNWTSAREACCKTGADLVIINSKAKYDAVLRNLGPLGRKSYWIGLHRDPKNIKNWLWVDGSTLHYAEWLPREPNNANQNEHCGSFYTSKWNDTPCQGKHKFICGKEGTATRGCFKKYGTPIWGDTIFDNCTSKEFINLENKAKTLMKGSHTNQRAEKILQQLGNITSPLTSDSNRPIKIYSSDLEISVNILSILEKYNSGRGNGILNSPKSQEDFLLATSNLLEKSNIKSWLQLDEEGKNTSILLVNTLDNYGMQVAESLGGKGNSTHSVVKKRNVVMRVDNVRDKNQIKTDGLNFTYKKNTIFLPPEVFSSTGSSLVTSFVYLTLNEIFVFEKPAASGVNSPKKVAASGAIVSSTVRPSPNNSLKSPVRIVLEKKKAKLPDADAQPLRSCVFWRKGLPKIWQTSGCRLVSSKSDDVTTCECDHLTVFASLMDPHGTPVPSKHQEGLEIISLVGCAISALAVLLTAGVTLFFRKFFKKPRLTVLLNICATIGITCTLVIGERWARDYEVACTVIATLLHYFLLAMFSWMLCEGVLLYILLVRVFSTEVLSVLKYFYAFGWGFPAIVVGVALGVTKTSGYGNKYVCWLSTDSGLIWAFTAPAIVVILVNVVVFVLVQRKLANTKAMKNKSRIEKIRAGVRASAVILPLLGITWVFGLLSFNQDTLAFKYIFTVLNSLQGLLIFFFNCVLDNQIREGFKYKRPKAEESQRVLLELKTQK